METYLCSLIDPNKKTEMAKLEVYFFLNLIALSFGANESLSILELKTYHLVPDIIESLPQHLLDIHYPSGVQVSAGNELTPLQVQPAPSKLAWPTEPNLHYTLLMTDPDASNRSEILHWLVVNIAGNDVQKGDVYMEYSGSKPPQGSGLHRYVSSVYKQPQAHLVLNRTQFAERPHFNTKNFLKEHHLGAPVAANFFRAQFHQ